MRIVCLAWGSLIWDSGALPVAGAWHPEGPSLPIEFARVGDKDELATVLCPGAPVGTARWARPDVDDVIAARRLLRQREEIDEDRVGGVGTVVVGQASAALLRAPEILRWAATQNSVDAVIWTALPPRFAGTEGRIPTPEEAAGYLRGLGGHERRHAEDYVRRVPEEIRTPNREALEGAIAS
jgi:hypothetical protein